MKKYISKISIISILLLVESSIVYFASVNSKYVADRINETVGTAVRIVLSNITFILPFSLFELLIILSPIILVGTIVITACRANTRTRMIRSVFALLGVISLFISSYIFTLGIGYHTTSLGEKIEVEDSADISTDDLAFTVKTVIKEINELVEKYDFPDGKTHIGYPVSELSERLVFAYDIVNVKPVLFSTIMSDLRISGIYSFFTGEANVNTEYPDYCMPFTAAHEMAHQRGISRENEANFVAFLVCINSTDEYIRYSGYLNMYEYLASALYSVSPELYYEVCSELSGTARADIKAASEIYEAHKDSPLGKLNDRLNDAYLKANGTEGIVSYGYVVRLAVGYYKNLSGK